MKKVIIAKQIEENRWKARVGLVFGKDEIFIAVLAVVIIGYVAIRFFIA
jgi:hypothetical protein